MRRKRKLSRVVRARRLQFDQAVEHVGKHEQSLRDLERSRAAATEAWRGRLAGNVGRSLSARELEQMAESSRSVARAEERSREQLMEARERARQCQIQLRQVEILRERALRQSELDSQRQEQREQDANSRSGRRRELIRVLLLLLATTDGGCNRAEAPPPPAPARVEAEVPEQARVCADEQFSPEELALLRKLRQRAARLREMEATLERRSTQLGKLEAKVDQKLKKLDQVAKAAPAPTAAEETAEREAQGRAQASEQLKREQDEKRAQLVRMIEKMSIRAAGAMLAEMPPDASATLLTRLSPKLAGQILAKLPAARAAEVAEQLRTGGQNGAAAGKPAAATEPKRAQPKQAARVDPKQAARVEPKQAARVESKQPTANGTGRERDTREGADETAAGEAVKRPKVASEKTGPAEGGEG
jgi:flagellar motility protein MotE (MotC chaperone)/flagellar biosynthesis chaperone FliJ